MVGETVGIMFVVIVGGIFVVLRLGLRFPRVSAWIFRSLYGKDDSEP